MNGLFSAPSPAPALSSMRRGLVLLAVLAAVGAVAVSGAAGGGTSDAAHACQHGGYLNLQRSDGSSFANVGDCVSYFAQAGTLPSCTVTATSGCLVFDHVLMPGVPDRFGFFPNPGWTVTVTAAFSFDTSCNLYDPNSPCPQPDLSLPNGYATGGGTYVIRDANNVLVEQGTLTAADTASSEEGLDSAQYTPTPNLATPMTCPAAGFRAVSVVASTNVPGDPLVLLGLTANSSDPSADSAVLETSTAAYRFLSQPSTGGTLRC